MPQITLDYNEIRDLIKQSIFAKYWAVLGVVSPNEITFNDYHIGWHNFTFEKKAPAVLEIKTPERTVYKEVKLEDVADMVIEQQRAKGEQDAV